MDYREYLEKLLSEKKELKHGELKKIFEQVADECGVTISKVRNYYYRNIKNSEAKLTEVDKEKAKVEEKVKELEKVHETGQLSVIQEIESPKNVRKQDEIVEIEQVQETSFDDSLRKPIVRPLNVPYKVNDIVDVEVTRIVNYGAFVKTLDEYQYPGLIHISQIRNHYVYDISAYLEVGDRIKAKVIQVNPLGFSVKDMHLPLKNRPSVNRLADVLEPVKEQIIERTKEEEQKLDEIVQFMNNVVGALSPRAKERLKELIEEHGIFKFSIVLAEVARNFENDLGLQLLNEVDEKIREGDYL